MLSDLCQLIRCENCVVDPTRTYFQAYRDANISSKLVPSIKNYYWKPNIRQQFRFPAIDFQVHLFPAPSAFSKSKRLTYLNVRAGFTQKWEPITSRNTRMTNGFESYSYFTWWSYFIWIGVTVWCSRALITQFFDCFRLVLIEFLLHPEPGRRAVIKEMSWNRFR